MARAGGAGDLVGASGMTPISYVSEQPRDYAEGLSRCQTLEHLTDFLTDWRSLCWDAYEIVMEMDLQAFKEWRKGLAMERRGKFAGEDFALKYGAVLMPETLIKVSMVATQCGAPWGCAYKRMEDEGMIKTTWRTQDGVQYRAQVAT